MTTTKKYLCGLEKSARIHIPAEQKTAIIERFGVEPAPYEWTEQDISVQISNYISCGEFVKTVKDNGNLYHLPEGVDF